MADPYGTPQDALIDDELECTEPQQRRAGA